MEQEKYVFTYTKEEVKETNDALYRPLMKRTVAFLCIMGALLVLSIVCRWPEAITGIFVGFFTMFLAVLISNSRQKELRLAAAMKTVEKQYDVMVTQEKIIIQVKIGEEEGSRYVFPFNEIKRSGETPTMCILQCNGIVFFIRKDMLPEQSILQQFVTNKNTYRAPLTDRKERKPGKVLSWLLFIASIGTASMAIGVAGSLTSQLGNSLPENMWVFFLFLPIPLTSIVYGVVKRSVKNIIVGFIMTVLLIVWGCFYFIPF